MSLTLRVAADNPDPNVVADAARVIRDGGVIVYPTDTLYGIGADATNPDAIRKVVAAKKRPDEKPILVLVSSRDMLERLVADISDVALRLMYAFWPGPLTIIFPALPRVAKELHQGSETIGIRLPANKFCIELMRQCNCPLTSTSANISGEPVHHTIPEIRQALNEGIDMFIDVGRVTELKPSTVVSVVGSMPGKRTPTLIREGVIPFERLHAVVPEVTR